METWMKNAEESVRKLYMAVEHSPESIVITDAGGSIEFINPKFTEVTGYTFAEAIGQNPRILQSGQTPLSVYQELWSTILSGEDWRGELLNRKKNGDLYWEMASISPVKDDSGRITHFVAVKQDITGRKRAEEEIRQSNEALQKEIVERETIEEELRKNNDELTRREQELRDSEERWRRLVENIPAGIAVHSEGIVVYANKTCTRLMGASRAEDLMGRPVIDFVHPAYRMQVMDRIRYMLGTDMAADPLEEKFLRLDGRAIDVEVTTMPITYLGKKAIMTVLWDIDDRKRAEEEVRRLMELRSRLASIVDSSEDAIVGKTLSGVVTSWNRGAEQLYGYTAGEMIGKNIEIIAPEDHKSEFPALLSRIASGEHIRHFQTLRLTKAGKLLHISLAVSPIVDDTGMIIGASSIARDITAQVAAAKALREKNRELEFLNSITGALNSTLDLSDKLHKVLRDTLELVSADAGCIYLRSEDRAGELVLAVAIARSDAGKKVSYRQIVHHSIPAESAKGPQFGELIASEVFGEAGFGTLVPVFTGDTEIGLLALYAKMEYPHVETVRRQLTAVSSQVGIAIDNYLLLKKLRDSGRYLEGIVNESPDPIMTISAMGVIVSFNKSASRLLKYSAEDMLGKSLSSLFPPGRQIDLNDPKSHVREFICKDGTLVPLSISASRLPGEEGLPGYVITLKDLSSIEGFKVIPITETASDTDQLYHFEKGFIYLFDRGRDTHYLEVFADQVKHNVQGLCVTRHNPKKIRQQYGLEKTPFVWLPGSDQSTDEQCIKPENMTALNATINKFLAEAKDGVVLLDGAEYLVARNSFESFLKLIHILNDHVMGSNSILMICVDPEAVDKQHYHLLTTEVKQFSDRAGGEPAV